VLSPAVTELTSFLRKANRALRQASLAALAALAAKDGSRLDPAVLQPGAPAAGHVRPCVQLSVLLFRSLKSGWR
jgi:hypothetical protein